MIWTPHTPIFGLKEILAQNWATKLKKSGQNGPFGALAADMEAQYVPLSTYNIPASRGLMDGGHLACWAQMRPLGAAQGPPGPPKGPFWTKTGPFGGHRSRVAKRHRYGRYMCVKILEGWVKILGDYAVL